MFGLKEKIEKRNQVHFAKAIMTGDVHQVEHFLTKGVTKAYYVKMVRSDFDYEQLIPSEVITDPVELLRRTRMDAGIKASVMQIFEQHGLIAGTAAAKPRQP